ncbi:MAG: ankyrin repeat domain-containing protein [Planctomycetes bacterium]|nr:ankyrin repeat domain-containing protein [Planctomycetota bacterium]
MRRTLLAMGIVLVVTASAKAVEIGSFPGLEKLIDESDAIVILRIDRHIDPNTDRNLLSTHECFIYQALKGPIPPEERIRLRLMDTRTAFSTPFALWSTHLMFLTRKRSADEPTEFRTIEYQGANIVLGATGHEKRLEGDTIAAKVRSIIQRSIETKDRQHAKEIAFLKSMLGKASTAVSDEQTNAATRPAATGTLVGRVLYNGEPPEPQLLRIPLRIRVRREGLEFDSEELPERRRIHEHGVPDESLIVGEDRGIANVIVWVRSKDVPVPPRRGPLPPATVRAAPDRFKPHVLAFWNASPLVWVNEAGAGVNFNLSSGIQANQALMDGQRVEIDVKRPLPIPYPLTSNIQPWFKSYVLPLAHPYFAVTDDDGRFEIKDLPPGEWEFAIWHERSGWLATDKYPRGRFSFTITRGENDLGDLTVEPQVLAPRAPMRPVVGGRTPNVDGKDNSVTEIHRAAMDGHPQRVRELIASGANVNEREMRLHGTPLHYAARNGHGETVKALIEMGVRVDARDTNNCTPLVWAVKGGHSDVIRRLLDAKANINAQDSRGWTPLHYSADRGHEKAAQLLIDRGADPLAMNKQGQTPIDLHPKLDVKVPWQSLRGRPAER